MKKIIKEFKEFISKGNIFDMAIGLIVGSAFTAIVNSLVGDIFSPLLTIEHLRLTLQLWHGTSMVPRLNMEVSFRRLSHFY